MRNTRCLVIAGTHSGVGKTTIATALMAAFARRGLAVQGFKVGPDFIDPTFHTAATGCTGRNLDGWMLSREANLSIFGDASREADVAVVEGVMGLFDGRSAVSEAGSTAEMAKWLGAPVVLIVDGAAMAASAAALVKGFESFDPGLRIAGVLFNRVSGQGHYEYLRDALAAHCRAKALGYLPPDPAVEMPERHLGLKLAGEVVTAERLDALAGWVERHLDLDELLKLAAEVAPAPPCPGKRAAVCRTRIGVARDGAFCFYYQDNLNLLQALGAELVEFSPVADSHLPSGIGGLYLGGGYPELHAAALSDNETLRREVANFARSGAPIYAECGGLMYLCEELVDQQNRSHPMAGVFPVPARMRSRIAALGYVEVEFDGAGTWLPSGMRARGHQFRYSEIDAMPSGVARCYRLLAKNGETREGYRRWATVGSYVHLHFLSCPEFASAFVGACERCESR